MGLSLRDQLLQAGFTQSKPEPRPAPPPRVERSGGRPNDRNAGSSRPSERNAGSGKPNDRNAAGRRDPRPDARPQSDRGRRPEANATTAKTVTPETTRDPNREPSLAAAYNARAETEKREREAAQRQAQEAAQRKREERIKLGALIAGKAVNVQLAEHTRNFLYGKKIRKVNVTAEQFLALNAGELGVVQIDGRFLILPAEIILEILGFGRQHVALFVPEGIGASGNADDDYSDPRFKVPDDLVW